MLTNDRVAEADNAAVALRLLGQHDRLVWYVADRRDIAAGDDGVASRAQLPPALVPALWLGAARCWRWSGGEDDDWARWSWSRCPSW